MSTLQMLDSVVGIIFIYLLLSLICTALNELLENIMKNRAKDLEKGIAELLQSDSSKGSLLDKFYTHPLISSLYKGNYIPGSRKLPSYIPASNFALALLDILKPASATDLSGTIGGGNVSAAAQNIGKDLSQLRAQINNIPNLKIQQALLAIIDASGSDIDKVRKSLEDWFNTTMDRVSGWYKRRVQVILIFMGIAVAVAVNADTIAIYKSLQNDPPLRNSLVAAAQEYAKKNDSDKDSSAEARIDRNLKKLEMFNLPIGWNWPASSRSQTESNGALAMPPWDFWVWLLKLAGWLMTGLAISLGAPFWFDTLNKIMVIRSTVKPHEKSPEEASQDKQKNNKS